ncbi:MAG TPA: hypothetical protein VGD30_03415 [Telluria sp.]
MSALADYGHIWRHAVAPSAMRKVVWVICMLSAAGGAWLVYQDGGKATGPAPVALIVLPVLLVAMLYWLELVAGAVKQLTPANAQLVPRLRARAIQLVAACFVVSTVVTTILLGGIFGNKVLWAAVVSAWLVGAAMTRTGLQHGMVLQFFPLMMMMLPRSMLQSIRDLGATPLGVALCSIVVIAVAWYGVRALFPTGGRHFRQRAAVEKGARTALDFAAGDNAQAERSVRGWYASDLARAGRNKKAAGELMLHAFGPRAHWSVSASVLAVLLLVLVAGRMLLELTAGDNQQAVSIVGGFVVFPLLLLFASAPQKIVGRAAVTAGEQSLLRLTPAAPQAREFNREVGDALMRRALIEWAIVTAGLVAVTVMVNAPWTITLLQLAVCCLALPLTTVVLRDYARSPNLSSFYIYFAALGLVLSAGVTYFASLRGQSVLVSIIAIVIGVGVTAVIAASRKRMMMLAPTAFPAGRMAS